MCQRGCCDLRTVYIVRTCSWHFLALRGGPLLVKAVELAHAKSRLQVPACVASPICCFLFCAAQVLPFLRHCCEQRWQDLRASFFAVCATKDLQRTLIESFIPSHFCIFGLLPLDCHWSLELFSGIVARRCAPEAALTERTATFRGLRYSTCELRMYHRLAR